jgi:hypothetical protein
MVALGVPPDYFWDEMSQAEFVEVAKASAIRDRASWEQTRLLAYTIASPNMKKPIPNMEKWIPFQWDKENAAKQSQAPVTENKHLLSKAEITDIVSKVKL